MAPIIGLFAFLHFKKETDLRCVNTPVSAPHTISQHRDTKVNYRGYIAVNVMGK
jgi:hypothetical protein